MDRPAADPPLFSGGRRRRREQSLRPASRHRLGAIRDAQQEVASGRRDASTISQQTAKNLLLWPDRARIRKVLELIYITRIEAFYPKRRIMEA
ncbi:MAG: transglycosylase domain-containing protein [Rhodospirillales bacterium]|nr:transglycosylase domain-containing protein [Rhodospirillales bacterium]